MDDSKEYMPEAKEPRKGQPGGRSAKNTDPATNYKRLGRMLAMQYLYQCDLLESIMDPAALDYFWEQAEENHTFADERVFRKAKKYAETLIGIVLVDKYEIDELITEFSQEWDLERMSAVDRNILRVAVGEMRTCEKIPHVVSINEAIEISKDFSDYESKTFINGILNSIKDKLESTKS